MTSCGWYDILRLKQLLPIHNHLIYVIQANQFELVLLIKSVKLKYQNKKLWINKREQINHQSFEQKDLWRRVPFLSKKNHTGNKRVLTVLVDLLFWTVRRKFSLKWNDSHNEHKIAPFAYEDNIFLRCQILQHEH